MKRSAFSIALLALSFAAASPARADWALIRFADGQCEIVPAIFWYGWPTIAVTPDYASVWWELNWAIVRGVCNRGPF
jgi:hypothetical protein